MNDRLLHHLIRPSMRARISHCRAVVFDGVEALFLSIRKIAGFQVFPGTNKHNMLITYHTQYWFSRYWLRREAVGQRGE